MPDIPAPRWSLPDDPSLEWVRRRAKELVRAAADPTSARYAEALELVWPYDAPGDGPVPLARAQRVLARAFGFASWARLREHLRVIEAYRRSPEPEHEGEGPEERFLRLACLTYTEPFAPGAAELLRADPSLALRSAHTMAVCARADELRSLVADDPSVVARDGGPHAWVPLLYLAYSRLALTAPELVGDPVATLRVLLEAGAEPEAGFLWHGLTSPFTALTGVLGGGERSEPPHPRSVELAELLLAAGADPNDNQALYNRAFEPDDSHLAPLLAHGLGRPHPSVWRSRLGTSYPSVEEMVGEHLRSAAEKGYAARVHLLLEHGVDPNTRGYHPILGDATAYEIAVRNGQVECARLLAARGGSSSRIGDADLLVSAALSGDRATVARLRGHAADAVRRRDDALPMAAELHGLAGVRALVDLGFPVDQTDRFGTTALHQAALDGDAELARWLLEHGADPTRQDGRFASTPAGWAAYAGHTELAAELEP